MKMLLHSDFEAIRGFVQTLPQVFDATGTVLYQGRNVLKIFDTEMGQVVVKSFRKPFLINRVAYTFFRSSKARRSYEHALTLWKIGISTPPPIAYIEEYPCGLLSRSFYLSGYNAVSESMRSYLDGTEEDLEVLGALADFLVAVHEQGVLHLDLSPGNILLERTKSGHVFSLVDINRMKFFPFISKEMAYMNFQALACSIKASTYIAEQYALCRGWNVGEAVFCINRRSDDFFSSKIGHFACKRIRHDDGILRSLVGPVQWYYLVRWFRLWATCIGSSGRLSGRLFIKEKSLYGRFLRLYDFRHVFEERYGYKNIQ